MNIGNALRYVLPVFMILVLWSPTLAQEEEGEEKTSEPIDPPHPISLEPADPGSFLPLGLDAHKPFFVASTINQSWEGMAQVATIRPPDPHGAVGPNGMLQTVNLRVAYYTKTGTAVWGPLTLSGAAGFYGPAGNGGSGNSDPRVMYDMYSNRFYAILQENTSTQFFLNIAVSKNSNPVTGGTADWYFYRFDCTKSRGATKYGGDYPGLGVDSQAVYVTFNMYPLPLSGSPLDCIIIILNKSLINGGTAAFDTIYTPDGSSNGFTLQPATVSGSVKPGNKEYFGEISFANTTTVRVWALSNPLSPARTLSSSNVTVPNHGGSGGVTAAPQSGSAITIATLTPRTQGNAFWFNGELWFCHTAGGGSGQARVYYYRVATNNFPSVSPTLMESGAISGAAGVWTYQPSIGANSTGDVCLVYSQSSSSTFPTIVFTTRPLGGSFETPAVLKASTVFSNSDRWGDYASVTQDPVDGSFWVTHEWSKTTGSHQWGTWMGNIIPSALPIQLSSFTGTVAASGHVRLDWMTISEINNYGFEIEESFANELSYELIPNSFVPGHGTTNEPHRYRFVDSAVVPGMWYYRLKQIDLDGSIHYSDGIAVDVLTGIAEARIPLTNSLDQNYPNPFNPSTTFRYSLSATSPVTLKIYNLLGQEVAQVVNEVKSPGRYTIDWTPNNLPSGMYISVLRAGEFTQTRRLILLK